MLKALLVLVVVVLASSRAEATPMMTRLDDVVKTSTDVVIATFVAPASSPMTATGYDLVVERALRGIAPPRRTLRVKAAHGGHAFFANGTRLVAFIDKTGALTYAATLAAGAKLEDGVLRLTGFNDGNVHAVLPGVMTLDQLEALVVKGTAPSWTFRGAVLVTSPTGGVVASAIEVTAQAPSNRVAGMPAMAGFATPTVTVGAGSPTDAGIAWKRPASVFALYAEARGKNADGSIAVVWKPIRSLTEAELRAYLADPKR